MLKPKMLKSDDTPNTLMFYRAHSSVYTYILPSLEWMCFAHYYFLYSSFLPLSLALPPKNVVPLLSLFNSILPFSVLLFFARGQLQAYWDVSHCSGTFRV